MHVQMTIYKNPDIGNQKKLSSQRGHIISLYITFTIANTPMTKLNFFFILHFELIK